MNSEWGRVSGALGRAVGRKRRGGEDKNRLRVGKSNRQIKEGASCEEVESTSESGPEEETKVVYKFIGRTTLLVETRVIWVGRILLARFKNKGTDFLVGKCRKLNVID